MKRRLFNIVSVLSLLVCLATAGLWVRSYWFLDDLLYYSGPKPVNAVSVKGRLYFQVADYQQSPPPGAYHIGWEAVFVEPLSPDDSLWRYAGFPVDFSPSIGISIPDWFVLGVSTILPFRWLWKWRRNRLAKREGLCLQCGYNLTGNVSGMCPECGTPVPLQLAGGGGRSSGPGREV